MRRLLYFLLLKIPFVHRLFWQPSIEVDEPGRYRYPCWDCNDPERGYHSHKTRRAYRCGGMKVRRGVCKRCHARRQWWNWLSYLETGEVIEVPDVDGEGWARPSTTNGYRKYKVYRLFGFEFVHAKAARQGRNNSLAARFWFQRFDAEGNTQGTKRIDHMIEYYEDE